MKDEEGSGRLGLLVVSHVIEMTSVGLMLVDGLLAVSILVAGLGGGRLVSGFFLNPVNLV